MDTFAPESHSYAVTQVLARRRRPAFVTAIALLILGAAYLLFAPRTYSSMARLHVLQGGPRPIGVDQPQVSESNDTFLNTQKTVATCAPVIALALGNPEVSGADSVRSSPSPLLYVKNRLRAEIGKKDEILLLEFSSADRREAATIANAIAQAYIDYRARQHRAATEAMLNVVIGEQQTCRADTERTYSALAELQKTGRLFTSETLENEAAALQRLRASLAATRAELTAARSALEGLTGAAEPQTDADRGQNDSAVGIGSGAELEQLKSTIMNLQTSTDHLRSTYGEHHPQVLKLRAQLKRALSRYAGALEETQSRMVAAVRERELVAGTVAEKAVQWARLQSDLKRLGEQATSLAARTSELRAEAAAQTPNVSVVEEARPADRASSPDLARITAVSLMMAIAGAITAAYVREWQAPRIESVYDVRRALGASVAGIVPRLPSWMSDANRAQCIQNDPMSDSASAIQSLASSLMPRLEQLGMKSIVVTAAQSGDGTTTVATNLALAFALLGNRVLLVDANCQAPHLHVVFDAGATLGFGDELVAEQNGVYETISTSAKGLEIMLAGTVPDSIEERLNGNKLLWLLHTLNARYDLVLFDTASLDVNEQARILAAHCSGTLLVARTGQTLRRALEQSYDKLLSVGARLAGVVINDVACQSAAQAVSCESGPAIGAVVPGNGRTEACQKGGEHKLVNSLRIS